MKKSIYDVLIIGGGPAGMTCALYCLRNNYSVLILEKESFGGQIAKSPLVENFPSIDTISGLDLSNNIFDQIIKLGCDFDLEEVLKIEKNNDIFKINTNYNEYLARYVVIASGLEHKKINLDNEDKLIGKGISYCATCDGPFFKDKDVCVIGDGNTALQYALLLSSYCNKVNLITLFDTYNADSILIKKLYNKNNIKIINNYELIKINGENKLESIIIKNRLNNLEENIITSGLFIAIGQIPNTLLYKDLIKLNNDGFILTNENMETSIEGLFAIGDCRDKKIRQVVTALNDGAIAALNISKKLID
ncbi:MAG: NAD(P)/FAD-dependent oxidoreductase [Bacillales bacterium]